MANADADRYQRNYFHPAYYIFPFFLILVHPRDSAIISFPKNFSPVANVIPSPRRKNLYKTSTRPLQVLHLSAMPPPPPRRPADKAAAAAAAASSSSSSAMTASERNQYIPSFITKKPFFLETTDADDYLEHQRLHTDSQAPSSKYEDRRKRVVNRATKFRKGACQNCGALGHTPKDCLDRPRKEGARWTGRDIRPDEVRDGKDESNWDSKRDQYATYDPEEYSRVVDEFDRMEKLRRGTNSTTIATTTTTTTKEEEATETTGDGTADAGSGDGVRYEEETDMGRNQPTSTRNLRIREDVAPYLRSLDPDSARYDPKTRRMLDSGALADDAAELVAEQGFMRASGHREEFERAQRLAWEIQEGGAAAGVLGGGGATAGAGAGRPGAHVGATGDRIHLQANPTHAQMLIANRDKEAAERSEKRKRELLAEYGGGEHFTKPLIAGGGGGDAADGVNGGAGAAGNGTATKTAPRALPTVIETETFVEYDPDTGFPKTKDGADDDAGAGAGDRARPRRKSKYPEDVMINNHTSVWGSWWHNFRWGFKCCYSTVKNSYCTGPAGRAVWEEERRRKLGIVEDVDGGDDEVEDGETETETEKKAGGDGERKEERRKRTGGGEQVQDGDDATERPRKRVSRPDEHEAMMEEYRREQRLQDDPLWQQNRGQ